MKTYNQLCTDIAFNPKLKDLSQEEIAVMGVFAYTMRRSKVVRERVEMADDDLMFNDIIDDIMDGLDVSQGNFDKLLEIKAILQNANGDVFIPEINDWIKARKKDTSKVIMDHVLLSAVNPDMYKNHESLYKSLYIAKRIHEQILKSFPNANIGAAKAVAWADPIDKLHRLDGHEYQYIYDVFWFAHKDDFWRTVILSTSNLRDHWGKIVVKMQSQKEVSQKVKDKMKTKKMTDEER